MKTHFRETVATFIVSYLADDQPRKAIYSGLNIRTTKVATEEHEWLETLQKKGYFIGLHLDGQATETTPDYTVL